MPSEAFTESSTTSSTDGADTTQRLGMSQTRSGTINEIRSNGTSHRAVQGGQGYGGYMGRHRQANPSMSSMSAVSDSGDRTDHLFALEEQDDD